MSKIIQKATADITTADIIGDLCQPKRFLIIPRELCNITDLPSGTYLFASMEWWTIDNIEELRNIGQKHLNRSARDASLNEGLVVRWNGKKITILGVLVRSMRLFVADPHPDDAVLHYIPDLTQEIKQI